MNYFVTEHKVGEDFSPYMILLLPVPDIYPT